MAVGSNKMRILVADNFTQFRASFCAMLMRLGFDNIDQAQTGQEVINKCKNQFYDLIFCDFELGPGKNGQHVLEELRHRGILKYQTLFIIISAETARDIVMVNYDSEPDDYLMKPISISLLEKRMQRLLERRTAFLDIYRAMDKSSMGLAIKLLHQQISVGGKYARHALKMLSDVLMKEEEWIYAERIFLATFEERPVDWARLGLAKVHYFKQDYELARQWLESLIKDSPFYLPAYDWLTNSWEKLAAFHEAQAVVQMAVDISPKSILRQKRLCKMAHYNGDLLTSLASGRQVIKLGAFSCHAHLDDYVEFSRVASAAYENRFIVEGHLNREVMATLESVKDKFNLTHKNQMLIDLLTIRVLVNSQQQEHAELLYRSYEDLDETYFEQEVNNSTLAYLEALKALGRCSEQQCLLDKLILIHAHNEPNLQKLDALLAEPVSKTEIERVMIANRNGIDFYNQQQWSESAQQFERLLGRFPKHIGVRLNLMQTLISGVQSAPLNVEFTKKLKQMIVDLTQDVRAQSVHHQRFQKLKSMAERSLNGEHSHD